MNAINTQCQRLSRYLVAAVLMLLVTLSLPALAASDADVREVAVTGEVKRIQANRNLINIDHAPVAELDWPRMTMNFRVAEGVPLDSLAPGDRVRFVLEVDQRNRYHIISIEAEHSHAH